MAKKKAANERKRAPNGQGTPSFDGRYYRLDVSLGRDPATGKMIRKTVRGDTEKDCIAKGQKLRVEFNESGVYVEPSKLTVGQWLDLWYKEYLGGVKQSTKTRYEMDIRLYLKPRLDHVQLRALAPHTIQAVYNTLQSGSSKQKALSAKSIKNLNGTLHSAMEKALVLGYLPRGNPTKGVVLPRVVKKEMQVIRDDDMPRFLDAIKDHQYEIIYLMDMFTGLRRGEILGLTWDCVDIENGRLTIKQQLKDKEGYILAPTKTDKIRTFPASLYVQTLLRKQRAKQAEWQLQAGGIWKNQMNLVFTNELGRYLVGDVVYNHLKKTVRTIGLDAVRFHDLRHTFALLSLEGGDNIMTLKENIGHSNISTTIDVYGHMSKRIERESAARMDARIEKLFR